MAKATTSFPPFPSFNFDAAIALQKANVEAAVQVQKILTDATQAAWQLQVKRLDAWKAQVEGAFKAFDPAKKPEAYAKDAQTVVEGAIADAKVAVEHGVKTQNEVAQVLTSRFVANLNELKALAA
jgi:hypothetical protein